MIHTFPGETMSLEKEDIIKGSIVGLLVGDAIGCHYRFVSYDRPLRLSDIDMLPGPEVREQGTYSNSAALSLCTMASINDCHMIDLEDIMERFQDCHMGGYLNWNAESYFIGDATSQAIKNYSNGMPVDRCGLKGNGAYDNEVLIRILPIGLFSAYNNMNEIVDSVHKIIELTHNSIRAKVCGVIYCLLVRNLLLEKPEKVFDILQVYYEGHEMHAYSNELAEIRLYAQVCNAKSDVLSSFWTAWNIFSDNQNSYKNCVARAVRVGGDCNVTAALAGSLCALSNGLSNIPSHWLHSLKLTPESREVIENFMHKVIK